MIKENKTNIFFVGGYYPSKLKEYFLLYSKVGLDFAANNLQEAIFKGFDLLDIDYHVINAPFLGSFPFFYKRIIIPSYKSDNNKIISLSYVNISYLKRFDIKKNVMREILKQLKNNSNEKVVLFYNFSCISIAKLLKIKFPDLKICLLITDLPEYMAADNSILTKINKKVDNFFSQNKNYYNYIDGYILLTSKMREKLPIGNKPWIQIEGIYNSNKYRENVPKEKLKTILYTGNIGKRYGILDLLDAFSGIDNPNYRLWIRGNGECLSEIKNRILKDRRIIYYEQMSRENLILLQKKATLLINPVHSFETFTKYFFPSKTIEYLASGTPTLMCKLACLPKEYESYIYFFDDESIEGMRNKIIKTCSKKPEELEHFGRRASNFILKEKTPSSQSLKITNFLKKL